MMDMSRIESADMGTLPDDFKMAPLPTREDVFGQLEELTAQHKENMNQYHSSKVAAKTHVEATLQEKLAQRKQRRAKLHLEETQRAEFSEPIMA
ncbi:unnamed protein product [Notodromas monacha]|uniref:Uncharacterized protein n=1 Tax=Notodromas monacha TaxID=399045 RepID=A0A7R9C0R8_9CRUS|nr:unnamed protein product [Notodromas monacha]CAG0924049.1 unnamed protein product [Notodromas monacha]